MRVYETQLNLKTTDKNIGLLEYFSNEVSANLAANTYPIRFVVTKSDQHSYHAELGVLETDLAVNVPESIFRFSKRAVENTNQFNAVMLVPTGIGALIGGHAGDAAPVSRLLASVCDNLITHPNVVNASDINEMTDNTLYVEGSVISRLLMGSVGLQKTRSNRVLTVIEKHPTDSLFVNGAINSVNAARAASGLDCDQILVLDPAMKLITEYAPSGRAIGKVEKLDHLFSKLHELRAEYDNIAITSIIKIPNRKLHRDYFHCKNDMINPWGGVEAIFTHTVSSVINVQSAHSPMLEDQLVSNMDVGVVDARKAAEAISFTYMQCILKGLQRAPRIVHDAQVMSHPSVICAEDISCLVIPDGCIGLPTLAALEQGIPVIAVRGNTNIMNNDLSMLPWAKNKIHYVDNYLEALGIMSALKNGIATDTVKRPLENAQGSNKEILSVKELRNAKKILTAKVRT